MGLIMSEAAVLKFRPRVVVSRDSIVHDMAMHLIAGMTEGLDLSSNFDVIRYLISTPDRYRAKVVSAHMDDAIYSARQIIIASVFGEK